jgi:1-phosphatidylinositol-3-phosphate 5-kinase
VRLVGGTYQLKGVSSSDQHDALTNVLRLAIYVYLSLVLEQHFFANSGIEINFSKPKLSPIDPGPPQSTGSPLVDVGPTSPASKSRKRQSLMPSGLISFISSKTGHLVHRATSIRSAKRQGSVDALASARVSPGVSTEERGPGRLRRFSLTADNRLSPLKSSHRKKDPKPPVSAFLENIDKNVDFLSTSVGMILEPPPLVVALAAKEKENKSHHLTSDEGVGLTSVLGWTGRDDSGNALSSSEGFIQHQSFSVLFSVHIPCTSSPDPSSEPSSTKPSTSQPGSSSSTCGRPRWITYRYYSQRRLPDRCLGETIIELCSNSEKSCGTPGCEVKVGQHQQRFVHGGFKIVADVKSRKEEKVDENDDLELWLGCKICDAKTAPKKMNDGT